MSACFVGPAPSPYQTLHRNADGALHGSPACCFTRDACATMHKVQQTERHEADDGSHRRARSLSRGLMKSLCDDLLSECEIVTFGSVTVLPLPWTRHHHRPTKLHQSNALRSVAAQHHEHSSACCDGSHTTQFPCAPAALHRSARSAAERLLVNKPIETRRINRSSPHPHHCSLNMRHASVP